MTRIIKADPDAEGCPSGKAAVLNLPDFAAEARRIVLDARKDAARIVAEARAKGDSVRRQARQQGYEEGFARGQADGHADGQREARAEARRKFAEQYAGALELVRRVAADLSDAREGMLQDAAGQILDLAVLLTEKIVSRVAVENTDAARANLAKVLEMAHCGGQIVVNVNPDQLESLRDDFAELVEALRLGGAVRLAGDPRVSPGGAVLVSRNGVIDATIETQLGNIAVGLLGRKVRCGQAGAESADAGRYEPVATETEVSTPQTGESQTTEVHHANT